MEEKNSFIYEITRKNHLYNNLLYEIHYQIIQSFNYLSIGALIDEKILAVHGGISSLLDDLK